MPSRAHLHTVAGLLARNHTLQLYCLRCDHWRKAPLEHFAAQGFGDRPIATLRLRCSDCGAVPERQLRPPKSPPAIGTGWIQLLAARHRSWLARTCNHDSSMPPRAAASRTAISALIAALPLSTREYGHSGYSCRLSGLGHRLEVRAQRAYRSLVRQFDSPPLRAVIDKRRAKRANADTLKAGKDCCRVGSTLAYADLD